MYSVAVALSLFDCMSVGYFLAFAFRAGSLSVKVLMTTHIGLLLGELSSRHAAGRCIARCYRAGCNKIRDKGIADIANSLRTNTTICCLNVADCGISDIGVQSLAEAIAANGSIRLGIFVATTLVILAHPMPLLFRRTPPSEFFLCLIVEYRTRGLNH